MAKNENIMLDVQLIELELQNLIASYPDLAEDEDLRADMVEGSTAAYDVLDRILTRMREDEVRAQVIAGRIDGLEARKASAAKRAAAMRRLALRLMTAGDLRSVKLPEGTLSRVKGRESVEVTDEASLPEWAFTVKVDKKPSKKAIGEALDAGIAVPGAQRVVGDETLQVR
jgi:hypothetical protein